MKHILRIIGTGHCLLIMGASLALADEPAPLTPSVRLDHAQAGDQDDLCFWHNTDDASQSLVITSDKKANLLAVYNLQGELLQTIAVTKPGNIDLRPQVRLGERTRDLVVVNLRAEGWKLAVFSVDSAALRLVRLDRGDLATGPNYGGCLYHSRKTGTLYSIITSESGEMEQYAFFCQDELISIKLVRQWKIGKSEGAVADDALGRLYIAEEERGVWELGAEPDEPAPGKLVIRVNEQGLKPDLEGITLLPTEGQNGFLLLSSQGQHRFFVYERAGEHRLVGTFSIAGAEETDGIDIHTGPFGKAFPQGVFGCHTAATRRCSILLTSWQTIAAQLGIGPR